MIWLTWRQFRGSAVMTAAVVAVCAGVLALTGPGLADHYAQGLADCVADDTCDRFFDLFFDEYQLLFVLVGFVLLALPAFIGLFWGAPLITRELESGTHLLAWSQGVGRVRWLAVKLGFIGLIAVGMACVAGLVVTWWSRPLDGSAVPELAQMTPLVFGARGVVPMGYAAFAFVLGVTVGMLVRRTLPAMALTLVVFVAVQVAMPTLVRPHFMAPVTTTHELGRANMGGLHIQQGGGEVRVSVELAVPGEGGAWVLSSRLLDPSGKVVPADGQETPVSVSGTSGPCSPQGGGGGGPDACWAEINGLGYRQQAVYHPIERFWPFQWIETGIYAALTLGLTWFSFWLIRRRLS
ncbi:ABC transporter permease [Herbidospora galbida]|uniref:ABC transporter permease n=1 Tax=Herbidospora galbida TaxID=2575442 RepID=A0A4U3MF30_9ACTN|nr:ABC transporter permease subunit [Herbidospora galbida]TKK87149.1 ABC transporter permease [Herbidospora galbida]